MGQATQVYSPKFDSVFLGLGQQLQDRIEARIAMVGRQLRTYPHHRLKGADAYRLRVGDYRIIYDFDVEKNMIELIALGHRRDIYRNI